MAISPSGRQFRLAAHDQELVAVEVGAGLRAYRAGGEDIVDGYPAVEACSGGRGQLLAPWPNRLAGGRFSYVGRRFQAPLSEPEHGNAIHGLLRWANWTATGAGTAPGEPAADTLTFTHRLHPQPGWGWVLDLQVTYRLDPIHGLEVTTTVVNADGEPCPVGLGWHPYIRTDVDRTRLVVPARSVYRSDDRGLPAGRAAVSGALDFTGSGRHIGTDRLDHCFSDVERDLDGRVNVVVGRPDGRPVRVWGDRRVTHLMVFSGDTLADPSRRRQGLAVEPMTCAPDMLNSGDGMVILEPGQSFEMTWGIDPFSAG